MPVKKAVGNMYDWVTHTHSHMRGRCPHKCDYCYAIRGRAKRFYEGPLIINSEELYADYGAGKVLFVEHMNDLFAGGVPDAFIKCILEHCRRYPNNEYVIQTKNPMRLWEYKTMLPPHNIIGTTIETDDYNLILKHSNAPNPSERAVYLRYIKEWCKMNGKDCKTFLTIEPIMDFDEDELFDIITLADPLWVNIGADSKNSGLKEPTWNKVDSLIRSLKREGIEIREKTNLDRLRKV